MKPAPGSPIAADSAIASADERRGQAQRQQIRSEELFGGQREILIEHAGELYSLRQTSKGKLILTK